ncbi:MAG: PIN domain-containing protein [Candidatus Micrarchaeota archaeon]
MRIIVDANVLFSALLKDSLTRKIWFNSELMLYSTKFMLVELSKYKPYLLKKYAGEEEDFNNLTIKLLSKIKFIDDSKLVPFLPAAESLISDEKDQLYIALALKEGTPIWSNDLGFKQQRRIRVFSTLELAGELNLL